MLPALSETAAAGTLAPAIATAASACTSSRRVSRPRSNDVTRSEITCSTMSPFADARAAPVCADRHDLGYCLAHYEAFPVVHDACLSCLHARPLVCPGSAPRSQEPAIPHHRRTGPQLHVSRHR